MIESDHQPDPLLTIKDYPGHTPGSIAINLRDGRPAGLLLGRHHASSDPGLSAGLVEPVLLGPAMSAKSRRQLLEDCVREQRPALPGPLSRRQRGYIKAERDSFRIEWDKTKLAAAQSIDPAEIEAEVEPRHIEDVPTWRLSNNQAQSTTISPMSRTECGLRTRARPAPRG